jgi:hypothetical protein
MLWVLHTFQRERGPAIIYRALCQPPIRDEDDIAQNRENLVDRVAHRKPPLGTETPIPLDLECDLEECVFTFDKKRRSANWLFMAALFYGLF